MITEMPANCKAPIVRNGSHASPSASSTSSTCYQGISSQWTMVTPALAETFMRSNQKNRTFMLSLSKKYESDMKLGQWLPTHEGIAFSENGDMIDGQHRLRGIIASGISVPMLVTKGLPVAVIEVINRGKIRTLAHTLQIMGYEHSGHRTIAVARRMILGIEMLDYKSRPLSDTSVRKFIDLNLEAIIFATTHMKGTTGPAPVAAVLARAFYHADLERLARFSAAMMDIIPKEDLLPGDQSARMLRRNIELNKHAGGASGSVTLYKKAQNALQAYLNRIDISKLYELQEDAFPLPEDKKIRSETEEIS